MLIPADETNPGFPLYMWIARCLIVRQTAFLDANNLELEKVEKRHQDLENILNSRFLLGPPPGGHSIRISPISTNNRLSMDVLYRHSATVSTLFTVTILPSLSEPFQMKITGRDKKGVVDTVRTALTKALTEDWRDATF